MLQKDNRYKVLKLFFDNPLPEGIGFQLREISRAINLAPLSVKRYLEDLAKERLIVKSKHRIYGYPVYYANRDDEYFRFLKRQDMVLRLKESGLIEYLKELCMPDVIILFGSAARGEDVVNSDVDIFLLCGERKLNLKRFEENLRRKISVFFCDSFNKLSKDLRNNVINGVIVDGYLRVF